MKMVDCVSIPRNAKWYEFTTAIYQPFQRRVTLYVHKSALSIMHDGICSVGEWMMIKLLKNYHFLNNIHRPSSRQHSFGGVRLYFDQNLTLRAGQFY